MTAPPRAPETLRRRAVRAAADHLLPRGLLVRRGPTDGARRVALTFDDGPDALTDEILDLLQRAQARATFFVVGQSAAARRPALLEILARGHEVAGHGYTHRPFPTLGPGELEEELAHTQALLPPPRTPRPLVRPPRGAISLGSLARTVRLGYTTVLWSLDSDDCRTEDAEVVAARVAPDRVAPGEIILLHEGQRWTLDALPTILDRLRQAGFGLVPVGELCFG